MKARQGFGLWATARNNGTSPTHASGQKLKSGNERIRRTAEIIVALHSLREGASERARDTNIESRLVLARGGVEITSCIDQEFTKCLICELRIEHESDI
jgi:hypothetical protein